MQIMRNNMKYLVLLLFILCPVLGFSYVLSGKTENRLMMADEKAENEEKTISLVVNGTGSTKEEATLNALRSAIEQTYGTFVSANTDVLNDNLVKDEIVTISSGNIKSYKELYSSQDSSGVYDVSLQAVVSIDQLTKFAQTKGMKAELAGAAFVMNMKIRKLNKENEISAMNHLMQKLKAIGESGLFDYELVIGEPKLSGNSKYKIHITILFHENENTKAYFNELENTLMALSLSESERNEYNRANVPYCTYNDQLDCTSLVTLDENGELVASGNNYAHGKYYLRNYYAHLNYNSSHVSDSWIMTYYIPYALKYIIKDNIGNEWQIAGITQQQLDGGDPGKLEPYLVWWFPFEKDNSNAVYYLIYPFKNISNSDSNSYLKIGWLTCCIPIHNYGDPSYAPHLNFNPMVGDYDDALKRRIEKRIYYEQEFDIEYTEEELSKLSSITIEPRKGE